MPVIISEVKSTLNENTEDTIAKTLRKYRISYKETLMADIYKTSLDARRHNDIHFVHSIYVKLIDPVQEVRLCKSSRFCTYVEQSKFTPVKAVGNYLGRPVIVGFGPAGMFCALALAENGYKPIILERGDSVESRVRHVLDFWNGGGLNESSNVQFGEGGAGTFSDGKLTTRIKDRLCRYVLERLVEFGATPDILTKAKAHIGTDRLRDIVKNVRHRIIELGGEVYFNSKMEDFTVLNQRIVSVKSKSLEVSPCAMVLAIGHSARDTFQLIMDKGVSVQPKPFSVGVRIEHTQKSVNSSLYGEEYSENPLLPVGEYQLSHRTSDGRAVYTFCMCPGGYVVPASSEFDGVVTNGMSEYARNGKNANSAMVVSVSSKDYGNSPLDSINFARTIEQKAYRLTGDTYKAPATSVGGFLNGKVTISSNITATYARGIVPCDLNSLFPTFVTDMLKVGLEQFSKKMHCFGDTNAIMTAPETRTSSPIRILRDMDTLNSISIENLYPCGEGAGYSGGIVSSAVDGLRVALKLIEKYPCERST